MGGAIFLTGNLRKLKEQKDYLNTVKLKTKLTPKMNSFLNATKVFNANDALYDIVYIVKNGENNPDLKYSLRSIEKFCNYRNIYIIGYKPSWIKDVKYIKTTQSSTKWKNATNNILTACNTEEISDNFILMNDDFFAIEPIINWEENLNICWGKLDTIITRYSKLRKPSSWQKAFKNVKEVLENIKSKHFLNYELHTPLIINKKEFKEMYEIPEIVHIHNTLNSPFHRRTVYKNLYFTKNPKIISDVKIKFGRDLCDNDLFYSWISVFDNVVENKAKYKRLNAFLSKLFPDKSKYEI